MAWDATKPAGTTAISGSDDLIRANWEAIEQGTVPYDALKLETQGSDPSAAADHGFLYTKDVSSKAELHYIDEDSNVIQLTSAGTVGSSTENFAAAKIDVDNLRLDGNTIISTDTNGDINLTPDGTGSVVVSKVDINSGAVDGTAVGANSASTGAFTTLTASTSLTAAGLAYPTSDGTNGQVLVTNGSGTLSFGSGSDVVYITQVTGSSDTSIDLTSGIDNTYDSYMIIMEKMYPDTDATEMRIRFSTDGGSTWEQGASDYNWSYMRMTTAISVLYDTADSFININRDCGNNANYDGNGVFYLFNPSSATRYKTIRGVIGGQLHESNNVAMITCVSGTYIGGTSAIDGVQFYMSSGNINGTVKLYGIIDS
jgi:hypothetical protein